MNRAVFISTLLMVLIFGQTSSKVIVKYNLGDRVVIQEMNIINDTQGLGWIEDRDISNKNDIAHRIEPFRLEEHSMGEAKSEECFRFSFPHSSNLFLIDLPPPACAA